MIGRTPLYRLCQQGFYRKNAKSEYKEHEKRAEYIKYLVVADKKDQGEELEHSKAIQKEDQIKDDMDSSFKALLKPDGKEDVSNSLKINKKEQYYNYWLDQVP